MRSMYFSINTPVSCVCCHLLLPFLENPKIVDTFWCILFYFSCSHAHQLVILVYIFFFFARKHICTRIANFRNIVETICRQVVLYARKIYAPKKWFPVSMVLTTIFKHLNSIEKCKMLNVSTNVILCKMLVSFHWQKGIHSILINGQIISYLYCVYQIR